MLFALHVGSILFSPDSEGRNLLALVSDGTNSFVCGGPMIPAGSDPTDLSFSQGTRAWWAKFEKQFVAEGAADPSAAGGQVTEIGSAEDRTEGYCSASFSKNGWYTEVNFRHNDVCHGSAALVRRLAMASFSAYMQDEDTEAMLANLARMDHAITCEGSSIMVSFSDDQLAAAAAYLHAWRKK